MVGIWWYDSHHSSGTAASKLVLQRSDLPGYKLNDSGTAKRFLPGLLTRYSVEYTLKDTSQFGTSPLAIVSSVSIFKTSNDAQVLFRTQALLVRAAHLTRLAAPALGTESLLWLTARGKTCWLAWRSGRIDATVVTTGLEAGRRQETVRLGEQMQSRIAGAS